MRTTLSRKLVAVRRHWRGPHEIALFALGYLVYFGVRAVTEGAQDDAVGHAHGLFALERSLGIDWERALHALALDSAQIRSAANAVYIYGHWPVLTIGGLLLFNLSPRHYFRLRNVCLLSGAIGLALFAIYPVAPPRLSGLGFVDTVTVHASAYRDVLPPSFVNEYAAMPSFHAGWNLMLGIALFQASRRLPVRAFAIAMPLAMGFATIATANHFVADVVVGGAIVVAAIVVVRRYEPRATLDGHGVPADGTRGGAVCGRPPRRERPGRAAPRRGGAHSAGRG